MIFTTFFFRDSLRISRTISINRCRSVLFGNALAITFYTLYVCTRHCAHASAHGIHIYTRAYQSALRTRIHAYIRSYLCVQRDSKKHSQPVVHFCVNIQETLNAETGIIFL